MNLEGTTSPASTLSKKCASCGLANFATEAKCKRCNADLSVKSAQLNRFPVMKDDSPEAGASKVRFAIIAAMTVILLVSFGALYIMKKPQAVPGPGVVQRQVYGEAPSNVEEAASDPSQQAAQSRQAAASVTGQLRRIQEATTRSSLTYEEYDELLNQLTVEVNRSLPSFTGRGPNDDKFRAEVNAAINEYKAAKNWWKTNNTYGAVLDATESKGRLQLNWEAARTHLSNAEKTVDAN